MTIDRAELREQGLRQYQEIKTQLPKDYAELARLSDLATEECLRQISKGTDGVMKGQMYSLIFVQVFSDMIGDKR